MSTKSKKNQLICPNCETKLDVDALLITQFEDSIRKDLQSELEKRERELRQKKEEFKEMAEALQQEREDINEIVSERVRAQMDAREKNIKDAIRAEIEEEKKKQLQELEEEVQRKSAQLIELNQTKAKLQRLSREFEEREAKIHLEKEQELTKRLEDAKLSMKEQLQMESFLVIKEKETIIESLKNKLEEARQKASQGSMQLQGEAQELLIEEILREMYPFDTITEVGKGVNGADCIQTVRTQSGIEAGKILYESKNTKSWSDGFIEKIKTDNLNAKCDLLVIVTKSTPKEMEGQKFQNNFQLYTLCGRLPIFFRFDFGSPVRFDAKSIHLSKYIFATDALVTTINFNDLILEIDQKNICNNASVSIQDEIKAPVVKMTLTLNQVDSE